MNTATITLTLEQLSALVRSEVRDALRDERVVPSAEPEVLDYDGVAELLQVDRHTIQALVERGLPAHPVGPKGGRWRFRRSEVLAWLGEQKSEANRG